MSKVCNIISVGDIEILHLFGIPLLKMLGIEVQMPVCDLFCMQNDYNNSELNCFPIHAVGFRI